MYSTWALEPRVLRPGLEGSCASRVRHLLCLRPTDRNSKICLVARHRLLFARIVSHFLIGTSHVLECHHRRALPARACPSIPDARNALSSRLSLLAQPRPGYGPVKTPSHLREQSSRCFLFFEELGFATLNDIAPWDSKTPCWGKG